MEIDEYTGVVRAVTVDLRSHFAKDPVPQHALADLLDEPLEKGVGDLRTVESADFQLHAVLTRSDQQSPAGVFGPNGDEPGISEDQCLEEVLFVNHFSAESGVELVAREIIWLDPGLIRLVKPRLTGNCRMKVEKEVLMTGTIC